MTEQNKRFLEDCRHQFEMLCKTGTLRNFNLLAMVEVMREEFEPACPQPGADDVFDFIHRLYMHYDRFLATGEQPTFIKTKVKDPFRYED